MKILGTFFCCLIHIFILIFPTLFLNYWSLWSEIDSNVIMGGFRISFRVMVKAQDKPSIEFNLVLEN